MGALLLLWLVHSLGWFLLSLASAILHGRQSAIALRYAVIYGLISAVFQKLVIHCLHGGCGG